MSSKKPSASVTSTSPSHSRPAASPLGAGVITGPNRAWLPIRITGVPTSRPTSSNASWCEALMASSNSVLVAALASDSGSPASASASVSTAGSPRRPSLWNRVPMAVYSGPSTCGPPCWAAAAQTRTGAQARAIRSLYSSLRSWPSCCSRLR